MAPRAVLAAAAVAAATTPAHAGWFSSSSSASSSSDAAARRLQAGTPPSACAAPGVVNISGLSGVSAAYGFGQTAWSNLTADALCITETYDSYGYDLEATIGPGAKQVVFALDVGFTLTPGWSIWADTCASFPSATLTTTLFLGVGCPAGGNATLGTTAWDSLVCQLSASPGSGACPGATAKPGLAALVPGGWVVDRFSSSRYYYFVVSIPANFAFTSGQGVRLNWTVAAPSATPTPSPSASVTPTSTPVGYCFDDPNVGVAFTALLNGTSGVWTGTNAVEAANWAYVPWNWGIEGNDYGNDDGTGGGGGYVPNPFPSLCSQVGYPTVAGGVQVFAIDLRAAAAAEDDAGRVFPWGGVLTVDTCGSNFDTVLFAGVGCPTDSANFQCAADSDDSDECWGRYATQSATLSPSATNAPVGGSSSPSPSGTSTASVAPSPGWNMQSLVRIVLTGDTPVAYVLLSPGSVGDATGGRGNVTLRWSYAPPSASPTSSPSSSPSASTSPSNSPSTSMTPSATLSEGACVSHTPLWTATGTSTPVTTRTPTPTGNLTVSPSWSQTSQATYSGTGTPVPTASRAGTPSGTPFCAGTAGLTGSLFGPIGAVTSTLELNAWKSSTVFTDYGGVGGAGCPAGANDDPANTYFMPSGNKHAYLLDVGPNVPLYGSLAVDLCDNPNFDTLLFTGYGCPTSPASWVCNGGADDSDSCDLQSAILLANLTQRQVYVILGGYRGAVGPYTLSWRYSLPAFTPTPRPTSVVPRSPSSTATKTVGVSRSNTATPSNVPTSSPVATGTPSTTGSAPATPSLSPTATSSVGSCGSRPGDVAMTALLRGTSGRYVGSSQGQSALFSYGNCIKQDETGALSPGEYNLIEFAPQLLFAIDLGAGTAANATRLYSPTSDPATLPRLTVDTCDPATSLDTMLFLGTSCPTVAGEFTSFGCIRSNDDACTAIPNVASRDGMQSLVWTPLLPGQQTYYVVMQPYKLTSGSYALSWRVDYPSPSSTGTPSSSASPSAGLSSTASPSTTASATASVTATATGSNRANAFRSSSVLLLKLGGPAYATRSPDVGEALPVLIDELLSGVANQTNPLQTIAFPTAFTSATSAGCTLATGNTKTWAYDQEGMPTLSLDGRSVTLPCYSTTVGNDLAFNDYKTIAVMWADGRVDTSTFTPDIFKGPARSFSPQAIRFAVAADANVGFYVSGSSGHVNDDSTTGGVRWVNPGGTVRNYVSGQYNGEAGHQYMGAVELLYIGGSIYMYGTTSSIDSTALAGMFQFVSTTSGVSGFPNIASLPTDDTPNADTGVSPVAAVTLPGFSSGIASFVRPTALVHENATSVWFAVWHAISVYNLMHYVRDPTTLAWYRVNADDTSLDTRNAVYSLAGRSEGGVYTLYACSKTTLWRFVPRTGAVTTLYTAKAGEYLRGVALPPVGNTGWRSVSPVPTIPTPSANLTATASRTPSGTATATLSVGAQPSSTPARSDANRFQNGTSLLLLRAGDGILYREGSYMPLFWDEVSVPYALTYGGAGSPLVLQSIALPSGPADPASGYKCTLARSSWAEGFPSTSVGGTYVVLPCYDRERSGTGDSSDLKTIATLSWAGVLDTTTRLTDAYMSLSDGSLSTGNAWTSVVGQEFTGAPVRFFTAGTSVALSTEGGVRIASRVGASTSANVVPAYDIRGLAHFNSTLYVAQGGAVPGIWQIGRPGTISGATGQAFYPLNSTSSAFAGLSIRTFQFENATRLWVASDHSPTTVQLQLFTGAALGTPPTPASVNWALRSSLLLDASGNGVYSVTGRSEGGVYAVYATTGQAVYRITPGPGASVTAALIATAPARTFYRAVAIPPFDGTRTVLSPSATLSTTPTNSPTPTRTQTRSPAATSSITRTSSVAPTPAGTPSNSPTASWTPSTTGTGTRTPSNTPTPTVSGPPADASLTCAAAVGAKVCAGGAHGCAVDDCGKVACWGRSVEGQATVPVAGQCGILAVGCGDAATCALSHASAVYCWGDNTAGQTDVPLPLQVAGGAAALSVGARHACAIAAADRSVVCWGDNTAGQAAVPAALSAGGAGAAAVAAGGAHTCAVTSGGSVLCWGDASNGATSVPPGLASAVAVYAGANHTCAIRSGGVPVCWGANGAGQTVIPAALAAGTGLPNVASAALGGAHSCFLRANGSATCTGAWPYALAWSPSVFAAPDGNALAGLASGASSRVVCGVSRLGDVACFGANESSQAGPLPAGLRVDPTCDRPATSPACTPIVSQSSSGSNTASRTRSRTPTATSTGTRSSTGTAPPSATSPATVSPTATASPSSPPTASATATASAPATATSTATGSSAATATSTRTAASTGTPSSTGSGTSTGTGSVTPPVTGTPTPTASASAKPTALGTATATGSATGTATTAASVTPSASQTRTPSSSQTRTPSASQSGTPSSSQTRTPSASQSGTSSGSRTRTPSASQTGTASGSRTGTPSGTAAATLSSTETPTGTPAGTPPSTATASSTSQPGVTPTSTGAGTPASTVSGTETPSSAETATASGTAAATGSATASASGTAAATGTGTPTGSAASTGTPSGTAAASATSTGSSSVTGTPSARGTGTAAATHTASGTGTPSSSQTGTPSTSSAATPSTSNSVAPSPSGSVTATPPGTSSSSATSSGGASATSTASSDATVTGTPTLTSAETVTRTGTPAASPSASASVSAAATVSATASATATSTTSRSPSGSLSAAPSSTPTGSITLSSTSTGSATALPTGSATGTPTASRTATASPPPTGSATATSTASRTGTPLPTVTPTPSGTRSGTPTATGTGTPSGTGTGTPTRTASGTGTPSASQTRTPSASQTRTPSTSQTRTPSSSQTRTPSASQTRTPSASQTRTPSASQTRTPSVSQTGTASPSQTGTGSASQTGTPSASSTGSRSRTGTGTGTPSPSGTASGSRSATPPTTRTGTPSKSRPPSTTRTPDATDTRTPTDTPAPPAAPAAFSLAVVRVGNATLNTATADPGTALPVFLDYVDGSTATAAGRWATVALRSAPEYVSGAHACTLSFGSVAEDGMPGSTAIDWSWETEGLPGNDADGQLVYLPCHTTPAGQPVNTAGRKTIAIVGGDSRSDTSMYWRGFEGRRGSATGMRTAYSPDGKRFWVAGVGDGLYGLRYLSSRSATISTRVYGATRYSGGGYQMGTVDVRGLAVWDGYLHLSSSILTEPDATERTIALVSGAAGRLPTGSVGTDDVSTLRGLDITSQRRSLWGFTFAARGHTIWAIEDRSSYVRVPSRRGVDDNARPEYARTALRSAFIKYSWTAQPGGAPSRWVQDYSATVVLPDEAVYGVVGRYNDRGSFVLFAASRARVLSVNTVSKAVTTLATAPAGTQFRGVAFVPVGALPKSASPSRSPSATATRTRSRPAKPRA